MDLPNTITTKSTAAVNTVTPTASCCFNLISRWFKRRKQSIDINANCSTGSSCKNKDFCYQNLADPAFARLKSKTLVTDSESLISPTVFAPTECGTVVRRTSILVLEPKPKSSIQYYKKRVSFADIMIRNEYPVHDQMHLHDEEADDDEEGRGDEEEDDHDHGDREEGDQGHNSQSGNHQSADDREGRDSKKKEKKKTTTTTTGKKRCSEADNDCRMQEQARQRRLQREYGRADQISSALLS